MLAQHGQQRTTIASSNTDPCTRTNTSHSLIHSLITSVNTALRQRFIALSAVFAAVARCPARSLPQSEASPGFGNLTTARTLYEKQQPNLAWWSNNIWGKFYRVDHDCWRGICLRQLKILVHATIPLLRIYTLWRRGYWSCRWPKCNAEHMYISSTVCCGSVTTITRKRQQSARVWYANNNNNNSATNSVKYLFFF